MPIWMVAAIIIIALVLLWKSDAIIRTLIAERELSMSTLLVLHLAIKKIGDRKLSNDEMKEIINEAKKMVLRGGVDIPMIDIWKNK